MSPRILGCPPLRCLCPPLGLLGPFDLPTMHFLSSLGLSIHLSSCSLSDRLYFCSPINVPIHLPAFRIFSPNKRLQHWSHGDNLEKLQLPFCFQPSSKKSSRLDFLVAEEEMPIGRLTTWSESKSTHNFYIICSTFVLPMLQKSTLIILTNAFFALEEIFCSAAQRVEVRSVVRSKRH